MKGAGAWIIAGVLAIAVAALAYSIQPHQDSPEHSSNSDSANGTSAVRLFAEAMGHPTDQIAGSFGPITPSAMMFVFSPTSPFTADQAERTRLWVRSGGILVYAAEKGDPQLDLVFGVKRLDGTVSAAGQLGNPAVPGVKSVVGGGEVTPLEPSADQVPFLRTPGGYVTGFLQRVQAGYRVGVGGPAVLTNGYLGKENKRGLLADLVGIPSGKTSVLFHEYHHRAKRHQLPPQGWGL